MGSELPASETSTTHFLESKILSKREIQNSTSQNKVLLEVLNHHK
jgi:hypothetical protein